MHQFAFRNVLVPRLPLTRTLRTKSTQFRTFAVATPRRAGQESALHHENRPEEAEKAKQQQLKEQEEGRGRWKEEIASDSERSLKAEKDAPDPETLQKQTQGGVARKHGEESKN